MPARRGEACLPGTGNFRGVYDVGCPGRAPGPPVPGMRKLLRRLLRRARPDDRFRKGSPIEAPPRPLSPSRRRHARRAPAGPAHSSTDGTQSKRTPVDHPSANSCKQEGQPFRLPQPHPVDDLTLPITADIGRSLQSCSYSPSRSSQSSPCQVRCCCSSFSPKCRKRHLGDMGSEKATSQMRTYIQPAGSHV